MKAITLSRTNLSLLSLVWGAVFVLLSVFGENNFQILNIVGFAFLILVPGFLTITVLDIRGLPLWGYLGLMVGFSVLELMLIGLLGNTLLPHVGVHFPLHKVPLLWEISIVTIVLGVMAILREEADTAMVSIADAFGSVRDALIALMPAAFVVLAVFGAIRLNDGLDGTVTLAMLLAIGAYSVVLASMSKKVGQNVIPTAIFFMALALLLMTSLRGWYVTGHDIQQEYKVFELAKNAGVWSMAAYRDAYNACLSITILPAIFSALLKIADPYVYKVLFQIIFASCASIAYLVSRNWANRIVSLLGSLYFIAFPTFFEDMPFLIRQEVAFLFYGLMLYLLFVAKLPLATRRVLFVLFGVGVILSHYSTTYTLLLIFGLTAVAMFVFPWLFRLAKSGRIFRDSALGSVANKERKGSRLTIGMITALALLSAVWTGLITDTGGNVTKVVGETLSAVANGLTENNRSLDAVSLITFGKPSQAETLKAYRDEVVAPKLKNARPGEYFDANVYDAYPIALTATATMPPTALTRFVLGYRVPIDRIVPFVGQLLAKVMELCVLLGMLYVLFRKSIMRHVDNEQYLLACSSLIFIAATIILPVLSTEYGVLRALQQSMFVLAPFLATGTIVVAAALIYPLYSIPRLFVTVSENVRQACINACVAVLPMLFLLYSAGVVPQLIGGNVPQLHLNDAGPYYDAYVMHASDLAGIAWIQAVEQKLAASGHKDLFDLQADKYMQNKIVSMTKLEFSGDIFPATIQRGSYVFLGRANFAEKKGAVSYQGELITYIYPVALLDEHKNLVYDNGGVLIYR
jgi:uncharacterized membrane protein